MLWDRVFSLEVRNEYTFNIFGILYYIGERGNSEFQVSRTKNSSSFSSTFASFLDCIVELKSIATCIINKKMLQRFSACAFFWKV